MNSRTLLIVFVFCFGLMLLPACGSEDSPGDPGSGASNPAVTSISPSTATVGQTVAIAGTNFGAAQGTGGVQVGGVDAAIVSWSDTQIEFTVPSGATSKALVDVTVTTDTGTTVSAQLQIPDPGVDPTITAVTPPGAGVGITVKITGTNFGASQGGGGVWVAGTGATIETWSDTEIEFTMPAGVPSDAQVTFTVTNDAGGSASAQIDIPPPNVIRITADNEMDHYPCWSGGGIYIYFCTTRFGTTNWEIARIPFAGGEIQRATYDDGPDFFPDVRHSSGELAWASTMDHLGHNTDGDYEIFTGYRAFQPGGISTTGITTQNESRDLDPAWAQTVYAGYDMAWTWELVDEGGGFVKWVVMRHGQGGIEEVTDGQHPNFSPNGRWIVYSLQGDLHKIETTGGTPVQLTDTGTDTYPHWGSNDRIVFQRYGSTTGSEDLYVMNSDGTDVQELIATRNHEYHPTWSPDASKVVYYAHRGSFFDIYVYVMP